MKTFLSAIVIAASLASANATTIEAPRAVSSESATTTYAAQEPFYHVVGDNSYIGAFQSKPEGCAVSVLLGPAVVTSPESGSREVKFDLHADETFTFVGNGAGASLNLHCAADAKSLAINQIWTPLVDSAASN
jgi:hypothetical protein